MTCRKCNPKQLEPTEFAVDFDSEVIVEELEAVISKAYVIHHKYTKGKDNHQWLKKFGDPHSIKIKRLPDPDILEITCVIMPRERNEPT